jgi:hypothetical protein
MRGDSGPLRDASSPICIGTGLIALDVLINGTTDGLLRLWAGGSCGNVLTILSYLGWQSFPIADLGVDNASETILNDMRRWNVNTNFIHRSRRAVTPIIIERLSNNGNSGVHEFKFKCPVCGSFLPRNKPLPYERAQKIAGKVPVASVFYFDRVSSAAVELAKLQRSKGALIVFEPCKLSKMRLFKESLEIAHIVKYSRDQIHVAGLGRGPFLEIQTLGNEGLKYRFERINGKCHEWKKMSAFQVSKLNDAAGAGDWCTAGIIHVAGQDGAHGLAERSPQEIEEALKFGQILAAMKCSCEGARGLMYTLGKGELQSIAYRLMKGENIDWNPSEIVYESEKDILRNVCPSCAVNGTR